MTLGDEREYDLDLAIQSDLLLLSVPEIHLWESEQQKPPHSTKKAQVHDFAQCLSVA